MRKTSLFSGLILSALAVTLAGPVMAAQLNTSSTLTDTVPPQATPGTAPQFATVIDDLPLMPGLGIVPDEDVLFAVPHTGRIAETVAQGMVDVDDVYRFYRKTLPQLGWIPVDGKSYRRDNDLLRIEAHADEKTTTVRFSIRPLSEGR